MSFARNPAPAIPSPYAPIRSVIPPEAPYESLLARGAQGELVLVVDASALPPSGLWIAPPTDHLLTPLDIVRRSDGHDLVLPVVAEPLSRLIDRRRSSGELLRPGEAITIAVSVIRGLIQAEAAAGDDSCARWWVSEEGRPLLVPSASGSAIREESAAILTSVADATTPAGEDLRLPDLARRVRQGARAGELARREDELFATASAEPLRPARDARAGRGFPVDQLSEGEQQAPTSPWQDLVARFVGADFAGAVFDTVRGCLTTVRRIGTPRTRAVLIAAAAGAAVIIAGLAWPSDRAADPGASDSPGQTALQPTASAPSAGVTEAPPSTASGDDPATIGAVLLTRLDECGPPCAAEVLEDPARPPSSDPLAIAASVRRVAMLDDLGGLVILEVSASDGSAPARFMTMVDTPEGWRIRDASTGSP